MVKIAFHYEISAEAKMAYDAEGNDASCLSKIELEVPKAPTAEQYTAMHQSLLKTTFQTIGIESVYFKPISEEEYKRREAEANEEDEYPAQDD